MAEQYLITPPGERNTTISEPTDVSVDSDTEFPGILSHAGLGYRYQPIPSINLRQLDCLRGNLKDLNRNVHGTLLCL